ncbi:trihelix transcription factor ASR3-like [Selaginella moellendorffii]|uniref:trihelix transcription factor ASR3-like n=1 Tax=Selaginella moellendorffii TaxID=88036 RepID=UPI000D1CEAF9|nr:trihelix transcription factor ASR3-like [Selaginella moellendorffii]|eukprot:XP_024543464.1 trihelix transcription factor ASR3-like [Selaginella moellendorffii]
MNTIWLVVLTPLFAAAEKRKRSRNWNIHEVLLLVQAKKDEWERTESSKSSKFESAVDKWVKVVEFLRENGIMDRDLDQCRGKWDNLLSDFKTIKEWHRSVKATPYTCLTKEQKKQNKLPALFDTRVIDLLESFYGTRSKLMVAEDHHQQQRQSYTATNNNTNTNSNNMSAVETALAIAACATTPPSATATTGLGVPHKKIKSSTTSSKDNSNNHISVSGS